MNMLDTNNDNLALDHKIVRLKGRLDADSVEKKQDALKERVAADNCSVVLSLKDVSFIDSTGLGFLVALHQLLDQQGHQLLICELSDQAKMLLELTRLNQIFNTFDSEKTALKSI